jgi:choline dehydrogenase-like flavoprotein
MSETSDFVIIGGGIIGSSVADHLALAGCKDVVVVERGSRQGLGSTGRATGGVRATRKYPNQLLVIRSEHDVNKVNLMNADLHGPFDNASNRIIETAEDVLSVGQQVARQAAGRDQILVIAAKSGRKLFR